MSYSKQKRERSRRNVKFTSKSNLCLIITHKFVSPQTTHIANKNSCNFRHQSLLVCRIASKNESGAGETLNSHQNQIYVSLLHTNLSHHRRLTLLIKIAAISVTNRCSYVVYQAK